MKKTGVEALARRPKEAQPPRESHLYGAFVSFVRRKQHVFTAAITVLYGVNVQSLRRKEETAKQGETSIFCNLLIIKPLRLLLRIAYLRPSHCFVTNTRFSERAL